MRLLVIGANGLLGSNVVRAGRQRDWDVCGTYHSTRPDFAIPLVQFNLQAYNEFETILTEFDPDVVINCAAMTDVDGCETDPETARMLNGAAPGALAAQCATHNIQFVHVSTDYVFDGTARDPYSESADPNPVQAYGESKLAGEQAVREEDTATLVARLSFVWGIHRGRSELTGFPAWVREQLQAGEAVPLFTDQWLTPTRAGQAADVLLDLIDHDASGIFHVGCTSCVTPYEFGEVIAEVGGYDAELLDAGSMDDVDRDATRPAYSCLDVSQVDSTLDRSQPTLREDVDTGAVRIFNAYGPRENLDPDSSHVIPSLCRKTIEEPDGGSIELFGDGTQERGFIYVTDLAEGMIEAIEKKADGEPINLGNAKEVVTMNQLAEKIIEISGKDISIEHDLSMPTGTDKYAADMTNMKAELDWEPSVSLDEGLERVYEWAEEELDEQAQPAMADGGDDE